MEDSPPAFAQAGCSTNPAEKDNSMAYNIALQFEDGVTRIIQCNAD